MYVKALRFYVISSIHAFPQTDFIIVHELELLYDIVGMCVCICACDYKVEFCCNSFSIIIWVSDLKQLWLETKTFIEIMKVWLNERKGF